MGVDLLRVVLVDPWVILVVAGVGIPNSSSMVAEAVVVILIRTIMDISIEITTAWEEEEEAEEDGIIMAAIAAAIVAANTLEDAAVAAVGGIIIKIVRIAERGSRMMPVPVWMVLVVVQRTRLRMLRLRQKGRQPRRVEQSKNAYSSEEVLHMSLPFALGTYINGQLSFLTSCCY